MPMIKYKCQAPECGAFFNLIVKNMKEIQNSYSCKECGSFSKRILSSPDSSSKIVVGRETQARQVEIYPNIVELRNERAKKGENRGD